MFYVFFFFSTCSKLAKITTVRQPTYPSLNDLIIFVQFCSDDNDPVRIFETLNQRMERRQNISRKYLE